jgi:hypothetical protein
MKTMLGSRTCHYAKIVAIFLIVVALITWTVGCGCGGPRDYNLTLVADPAAGGTATDETKGSPYTEGTIVSIEAEANTGYQFANWTAPAGRFGYANAESTIFAMPRADTTITANFVEIYDLDLAANPVGGGTAADLLNVSPYVTGTVVSIQAVPSTGYRFVNWTGDLDTVDDANNPQTAVTMDDDCYVIANFEEIQVGVRAGDWMKFEYVVTDWPGEELDPLSYEIEFVTIEATNATVRMTVPMPDGTEESDTSSVYVGETNLVIAANLTPGDYLHFTEYGYVTIDGETTREYAGANRTVVYATGSEFEGLFTYYWYWDKLTGVMVEMSMIMLDITQGFKATETNMWSAYD